MNPDIDLDQPLPQETVSVWIKRSDSMMKRVAFYYAQDTPSLNEIYETYKLDSPFDHSIIYVFADDGRSGRIYRCGNYTTGQWDMYAKTTGYA